MSKPSHYKVAVLISGTGSNLNSIIAAQDAGHYHVACVISNNANASGLNFAKAAHIPTHSITQQTYPKREDYDAALAQQLHNYDIDLIVLAGFMRILSAAFVEQFYGRLINIHPSLLPKYPGLHTHQRVLDAGDSWHGTTVHFVNNDLDAGPVIAQATLKVATDDTVASLQQRVKQLEHQLYPKVLSLFARGQIRLIHDKVMINGET